MNANTPFGRRSCNRNNLQFFCCVLLLLLFGRNQISFNWEVEYFWNEIQVHSRMLCVLNDWMNEAILSRSDCKQVVSHTRKLKASYTIPALSIENFIFQDNNETMKQKPSGLIYSSSSSSFSSLFFILYKKQQDKENETK